MEEVYIRNPFFDEGELSKVCSMITNNQTFAVLAVKLGLHRAFYYDYNLNHKWQDLERFSLIQEENGHRLPHQLVNKIFPK